VKLQTAESGKWNCDRCRAERLRVLEEDLRNAQTLIEELTRKNEALVEQLRLMASGKDDRKQAVTNVKAGESKCLVLGDSIIRNVGVDKSDIKVECFPGIRAEQLRAVMERKMLGCPDTVILHVGTNDVRGSRNLDYIMGEVYDLVNTAKAKFPGSRLVLSGVLRSNGVSWRRVGAANDRFEWVATVLGATFVDPNSWIRDNDFCRDGLHLSRRGAGQLGDLYGRVAGIGREGSEGGEKQCG
jgi:hypothetical protein